MGANPSKTESESESKAFPQTISIQHSTLQPIIIIAGWVQKPNCYTCSECVFFCKQHERVERQARQRTRDHVRRVANQSANFFRLNHCWTLSTFYLHWLEGVDWYYRLHLAVYVCNHRGPRRPTSSTATPERLNNFFNCSVAYFIK